MLPVFRIALKYKASDVIEALASQLEQDWPQTISEWDASQLEGEDGLCIEPSGDLCSESGTFNRAGATVMESASAIQVAHIANLPNILSVAYYRLCRISSSDAWWQDIVSQGLGATKDCHWDKEGLVHGCGYGKEDRQTLLSKEDLCRIVSGKDRLAKHVLDLKQRLTHELMLHPRCAWAWNTAVTMQSEDPLSGLLELCSAEVAPGGQMCVNCRILINERGREERARIWELLPQIFCLVTSQ